MAHIKMDTALILVVLVSAISAHAIPRLSDLSHLGASKLIKLYRRQEENSKKPLESEQNKILNDQYMKLLKQFAVLPNEEEIDNEIKESLGSSEEMIINKRHDDDYYIINAYGELENTESPAVDQDFAIRKSHNHVEEEIETITSNYGDDAIDDDNVEEINDEVVYKEIAEKDATTKKQSGDEPTDVNGETNDYLYYNESALHDSSASAEKQIIDNKKVKRHNDDNDDLEETKDDLNIDRHNKIEEKISSMFVNRFNKITK